MSPSIPPWLHSPRGLTAAGIVLVILLVTVPDYVSRQRSPTPEEASTHRSAEAGYSSRAIDDSLQPFGDDWLTAGAAPGAVPSGAEEMARESALDCLIQPSQIVEIGSQTVGLIEAMPVDRGDAVEAGQVVVELEAGVEHEAVEVARMRASMKGTVRAREQTLQLSTKRRDRATELYQQRALSQDSREELETQARIAEIELLQAREELQLASLDLRQAQAVLARRTLRTPISGVVVERLIEPGEVVDEETILRIARTDTLRVDVLMPASRYGTVESGMRAAIEPEFPVDATVVGTVSVVDPIIDAASGTFSVRLDLPNPDGGIPGGLHCTVKFLDD